MRFRTIIILKIKISLEPLLSVQRFTLLGIKVVLSGRMTQTNLSICVPEIWPTFLLSVHHIAVEVASTVRIIRSFSSWTYTAILLIRGQNSSTDSLTFPILILYLGRTKAFVQDLAPVVWMGTVWVVVSSNTLIVFIPNEPPSTDTFLKSSAPPFSSGTSSECYSCLVRSRLPLGKTKKSCKC